MVRSIAPLENLLEMQTLGPQLRPTRSTPVWEGLGCQHLVNKLIRGGSDAHGSPGSIHLTVPSPGCLTGISHVTPSPELAFPPDDLLHQSSSPKAMVSRPAWLRPKAPPTLDFPLSHPHLWPGGSVFRIHPEPHPARPSLLPTWLDPPSPPSGSLRKLPRVPQLCGAPAIPSTAAKGCPVETPSDLVSFVPKPSTGPRHRHNPLQDLWPPPLGLCPGHTPGLALAVSSS